MVTLWTIARISNSCLPIVDYKYRSYSYVAMQYYWQVKYNNYTGTHLTICQKIAIGIV